ncbi:peptidylprolyl isomerase [Algoriphagus aquimarinus]|uniref:Peptidyl-prolyl cis-trans isomerase n=1 Tax=Algoriphagus aquimarinus TaxID=237018 RepID=A0A1I0Z5Y7_9BACT|nr:peptidylprolyl isomerase [Algoriphagus aquimarinus]SFB20822.1 peptidyl-prolyl cis-trans isomerase B (cyclophilin B) [Algoriphagus aquimarinus]
MKNTLYTLALLFFLSGCHSLSKSKVSKKDLKKDIEFVTTEGTIVLRLYDDTPISQNNFLRLVKEGMYDSILFHRVIEKFMIQAGERFDEDAFQKKKNSLNPSETVPAEINSIHYHKRGALGAAREGDDVNPDRKGSFIQFYIVQGRTYTDSTLEIAEKRLNTMLAYNQAINNPVNKLAFSQYQELLEKRDSKDKEAIALKKSEFDALAEIELKSMTPYRYPESHREAYKTTGGAAHLDQNYTVFGEVISGMEIVDKIAAAKTNNRDRPANDILILSTSLVKRQK